MSALYESCAGCGAETPSERCFGCFHDFGSGLTTPSNANTSGLAIVAWRYRTAPHRDWHETECSEVARVEEMDGSEVEPLHVTAASAQARIAELERWQAAAIRSARIHDENIREFDARATAAEARADRLADIVKLLDECIWFNPDTQNFEVNHDGSVEKARAALQQEIQP